MTAKPHDPLAEATRQAYMPLAFAALFSFGSNLLFLVLPLYMTQIYDRVIPSQSVSTLAVLTAGVVACFMVVGVLEDLRTRVLIGLSGIFDHKASRHVFAALFDLGLRSPSGARAQALRDLDTVRQTMTGSAIATLFDAPWAPVFVIVLFVIDPFVGAITLVGGIILLGLAYCQDKATRPLLKEANEAALRGYNFTEASLRNAEVVRGLGMLPGLTERWAKDRTIVIEQQAAASGRASFFAAAIRVTRLLIQIAVLAVGALLVLERVFGPGVLFANMILSSRALAPVERLVSSWNALIGAGQARERLMQVFREYKAPAHATALPRPEGRLTVEGVSFTLPGMRKLLLRAITFDLQPGEVLGIIGLSGAGKSTLIRLLVGIWPPSAGSVRLDGADIFAWDRVALGRHIGYLPQDVELFAGTVRDNIARFRSDVTDDEVVEAAKRAGVHDMILRLSAGYDTALSEGGSTLSVGQRQRLALARALLGTPALVILDEPNANLDTDGEAALMASIEALREEGATVVIVSHKPSLFRNADKILVLKEGQIDRYGPRDAVFQRAVQSTPTRQVAPVRAATGTEAS